MSSFKERLEAAMESYAPPTLEEMIGAGDELFGRRSRGGEASGDREAGSGRDEAPADRRKRGPRAKPARRHAAGLRSRSTGSRSRPTSSLVANRERAQGRKRPGTRPRSGPSPSSAADRPRVEDVEQSRVVLLEPTDLDLSRDEVIDACLDPLVKALEGTCRWSRHGRDWQIGDYRCLVLLTSLDDVTEHVQWWSEPLEDVHVSVICGASARVARRLLDQHHVQALADRGYSADDHFGWFWKELALRTGKQVRAAAREALEVFFDVYGYRGRTALDLVIGHGTRTERRDVYETLTPQDLVKLLGQFGCTVGLHPADGDTPVYCEASDGQGGFLVFLGSPAPGNRYGDIRFCMPVKERTPLSPRAVNAVNQDMRFVTLSRGEAGLWLAMDVEIAGGVTPDHLRQCFGDWWLARKEVRRLVRAAGRAVRRAPRR